MYSITGKPISYHHGQKNEYSDKLNYEYCLICLNRRKEILHKRIGQRVEEMVERGLVEEVSELWERYNRINLNAFWQ